MTLIIQQIQQSITALLPSVIEWRRDFHQHPELSNREERTSGVVEEILRQSGVNDIQARVAHHGVVALIHGAHPGPCVALRADMDALPVTEQTGLPYSSNDPGVMHACGHDCHTAILLGVAHVLAGLRAHIHGSVKLIFQPCEEGAPPGEEGGAALMVKEGVLENPAVSALFGLHINPLLETGHLTFCPGGAVAAVDSFTVTVQGKQTHAAYPWEGDDPIVAASHIVLALQTIVSRMIDTRETAVVSVGSIQGGNRWNIIPGQVTLTGTIRTHNGEVREKILQALRRIATKTAESHGVTALVDTHFYGPVVWNDHGLVEQAVPVLREVFGKEHVRHVPPAMHGEDFAYFAGKVPGFFFKLGVGNKNIGAVNMLHTPNMILDEDAIPIGMQAMSLLALNHLNPSLFE
jgi:amidohydrolase